MSHDHSGPNRPDDTVDSASISDPTASGGAGADSGTGVGLGLSGVCPDPNATHMDLSRSGGGPSGSDAGTGRSSAARGLGGSSGLRAAGSSAGDASTIHTPSLGEAPGASIGPYRLMQVVGEGGFGTVYEAEQERPVRRRVALKIIKLGMDTRQVIARFEAERQALAMMDHPHIARVLDAGATEAGRPYFVMELVRGVPITQFCDRHNLTTPQRLELFVTVCQAVQHAHQKGIIHRDLKPSNVLVSRHDDRPVVKVIDFGIAKATGGRLTDKTVYTEIRQMIGTPAYMSPEQAGLGDPDVDTRSDVYSLGVLLYELLTGTTPFDMTELHSAGYAEVQRVIREVDPPKPSTRLSSRREALATVAAQRRTEPARLTKLLRGDLDWIAMKCLEKDRTRRYETANGLAADITRYLGGEPVSAAPPSTGYRLRKFVRRHRGVVLAGGAVAAALLMGVIAFGWQAGVARRERDLAQAARDEAVRAQMAETAQRRLADEQRNRAVEAEARARQKADELKTVVDFQTRMFEQVDPARAGQKLTSDVRSRLAASLEKSDLPAEERARQTASFAEAWTRISATDAAIALIDDTIMRPAVDAIAREFKNQPQVRAKLQQVLADRYFNVGLVEPAVGLQQEALATRKQTLGENHRDTLVSHRELGVLLKQQGKLEESEAEMRAALESQRRLFGNDDPDTINTMAALGALLTKRGKWTEGEPLCRDTLSRAQRVLGPDHTDTQIAMNTLGQLLKDMGKLTEAEHYHRETVAWRRRTKGDDDPVTVLAVNNLGTLYFSQGRFDEAEACFREAAERDRRVLGDAHPYTLQALGNLSQTLARRGKDAEAEALMRSTLAATRQALGDHHPDALTVLSNLAVFLIEHNKLSEAEPMCRESLEHRQRLFGSDNPLTLVANSVMGYVLKRQNKLAEAEPFVRAALETSRRTLREDHPDRLTFTINMGMLLRDMHREPEAEPYFREALEKGRPSLGAEHPVVMTAMLRLSECLLSAKRFDEAAALLLEAEPTARKLHAGADQSILPKVLGRLGKALAESGNFAEAAERYREAFSIFDKNPERVAEARTYAGRLGDMYAAWDAAEPGRGHDRQAAEWRQRGGDGAAASRPAAAAALPPTN